MKTPIPGPRSKQLIERWLRVEADSTGYQAPVVWERGQGCVITDVDGNTYLDWTSGVLVTNVAQYGPAWNAGVRRDLVIQRVNGTAIRSVADFDRALEGVEPGDVVSLDTAFLISEDGTLGHRIINILIPEE